VQRHGRCHHRDGASVSLRHQGVLLRRRQLRLHGAILSQPLFLERARQHTFGYGRETESSVEAADDFIVFLQGWLELFPEFKGRQLIIAGESYGGHYIPAWGNALLNYNEALAKQGGEAKAGAAGEEVPINFAGMIIGNGCVNNTVQNTKQFIKFQHECNLIPADANPKNEGAAYAYMISHLGYTPNYYDYRVESVTCAACYGYDYTAWSYWFLQPEVLETLHICGDAGNDAFAGAAGGCISMGAFDSRDDFDYSGAVARTLEAGVPVTFYFGKVRHTHMHTHAHTCIMHTHAPTHMSTHTHIPISTPTDGHCLQLRRRQCDGRDHTVDR
jgi:hypothetical protein